MNVTSRFVVLALAAALFHAAGCSGSDPSATGRPAPSADAGPAPSPDAGDAGPVDAGLAELPAAGALRQALADTARDVAPGAILRVQHPGYRVFSAAAGVADATTGAPLTPEHAFRAGSMLKTLVATAVLQRVEAGELGLDAKLTELVPAAVHARIPNAATITLRMLLQHTSGIADFAGGDFDARVLAEPAHRWTLDELLGRVAASGPTGAPGAAWSYSNTNYVLLGEILAAVRGTSWRAALRADVLGPLGLTESALPEPGDATCAVCARGYETVAGMRLDASEVDPSMAGAAGGDAWITTTRDTGTFLAALWAGRPFTKPESTRATMLGFVDAPLPEEAQTGYGLGLARFHFGDREYVGHLGGTAGYQSFMLVDTASGAVLTGAMTTRGDLGAFLVPVLEAMAGVR